MKPRCSETEAEVRKGETVDVIHRGRPTLQTVPAAPRPIPAREDHLATAIPAAGRTAEETIAADREGRW